jgi:hypothetical protein
VESGINVEALPRTEGVVETAGAGGSETGQAQVPSLLRSVTMTRTRLAEVWQRFPGKRRTTGGGLCAKRGGLLLPSVGNLP